MTDFDQLYRDYFRDVFLYVRRLSGGNERLAEDVTSEAFFRAMKSVDSFRGDCDVRVWLCQIAKNCYYTHLKQSRRATPVEAAEQLALAQEGESPEEFLLRGERARQIQRLLHELPDPWGHELPADRGAVPQDGELGLRHLSPGAKHDSEKNGGGR